MKAKNNILSTASIPKLFMKYCIPAVVAMIISGVQGMIDGIFVGNYINSNALASVNIAMPFMHLIFGLSMIVSIGTQSYVGIALGKGENEKAQNSFNTFKIIIIVCAGLITVFGLTLNKQIASLLGADSNLIAYSSTYIKFISVFAIPMCVYLYFGFLNRIVGKPEKYFFASVLSVIVNVSLDYLLIARLEMGVMGAALATGAAYSSALFVVITPMLNKKNVINIFVGKFSSESIKSVLYNGSSEGINSISAAVIAFLFNTSLMRLVGADGVAAFTAINYVGNLGSLLLFGVSDGVGPIVSYNFGTKDIKRVNYLMKLSYIFNFIFGIILFILLFYFGEHLVGLFIKNNPSLIEIAVLGGKLYAISFLMAGFNILNSGYFTFIGKGFESVVVAASRGFIFVSIGVFVLPLFLGTNGIWLSVAFAEFCAVIIGLILLKFTKRTYTNGNLLKSYDEAVIKANDNIRITSKTQQFGRVITVNRQFGSGGREVSKRLANLLNCAYYDKEIINYLAEDIGQSPDLISKLDEMDYKNFGYTFSRSFMLYNQLPIAEINLSEKKILKELAQKTKGVYVGRCSNYILQDYNPFKVFIYSSDMNFRIDRCIEKSFENLQSKIRSEIQKDIIAIDEKRKSHYNTNTGERWDDINNYHLCIDTSEVGIKKAVDVIINALNNN